MLQMLSEVVCAEEFLGVVALAKFVHGGQVLESSIPVRLREIGEFLPAVPARVVGSSGICLAGLCA
jgi:hypothetical protein